MQVTIYSIYLCYTGTTICCIWSTINTKSVVNYLIAPLCLHSEVGCKLYGFAFSLRNLQVVDAGSLNDSDSHSDSGSGSDSGYAVYVRARQFDVLRLCWCRRWRCQGCQRFRSTKNTLQPIWIFKVKFSVVLFACAASSHVIWRAEV